MTAERAVLVPDGLDGERVDVGLARLFGFSRSRAVQLIADGAVQVAGAPVAKSARLVTGQLLELTVPDLATPQPAPAEPVPGMGIIFDDDDIVVVDKPVGVAAHPSVGWSGPTVVGGLAAAGYRISTSGAAERQGVVSRLDVGTSGLMVVAKSEHAYTVLKRAFKTRSVDKTYHALVQGLPDPLIGTIDAPIGRHKGHDFKFAVMADGRAAITHYELLEAYRHASLMSVRLETGRTHQIRVHFAALHRPLVGDLMYGADPTLASRLGLTRQWLHAMHLGFDHPRTGDYVTFDSSYPQDLTDALDRLNP